MSDDHREEPVEEDASSGQPWVVDEETASRLALLASYVEDDGRLSVPGLVVKDHEGRDRIVIDFDGHMAQVAVRIGQSRSPVGVSEARMVAADGDDADISGFPPRIGVDLSVSGDVVVEAQATLVPRKGVMGAGDPELHCLPWVDRDA